MKLSIVTTLYHSEPYVVEFYEQCKTAIAKSFDDYEFIFVNDGSPDSAMQRVLELQLDDEKVVLIDLTRNFGHHRAMMTGLRHISGDYAFLIDSDLEEDPALIGEFWTALRTGENVDSVFGVQKSRKGSMTERWSGNLWYFAFSLLTNIDYPANTLTARLMTRRYVDSVTQYGEKELELWGIFSLVGYNQKAIDVVKRDKGKTTYTTAKKLRMMVDSITSFSSRPLVSSLVLGLVMTLVSSLFALFFVAQWVITGDRLEVWTITLVSVWFIGGLIILSLGTIGIYVAKIFLEIKNRPISIIRDIHRVN